MGIEDFEWEAELEGEPAAEVRPQPAQRRDTRSWLARACNSVWVAPALRLGGMAMLLGVLAGIGVVATTYAKPGMKLPETSKNVLATLGTSWLKPSSDSVKDQPQPEAPTSSPLQLPIAAPGAAPAPTASAAPAVPAPAGVTPDGKIVLNLASAEELTQLPGVGMKRAQAIVALRIKLKRFKQVTDIMRVKGIGPRGLKRMLPHLVLDAP